MESAARSSEIRYVRTPGPGTAELRDREWNIKLISRRDAISGAIPLGWALRERSVSHEFRGVS